MCLRSESTPQEYLDYLAEQKIKTIIAGRDRIDMRAGMETLQAEHGVATIRVDSGGTLNSVMLATGLVTEVSVLIHPFLAGGRPGPGVFDPERAGLLGFQVPLKLKSHKVLEGGLIWARYAPLTRENPRIE
jgi:2,5-diamino-6-(ribosylamino)-4(3H)-pyrimidinone 5'-phosphate reductase